MAIRQYVVHLHNDTPHVLRLHDIQLDRGALGEDPPPAAIEPRGHARWKAESDRWLGAAEGSVDYHIDDSIRGFGAADALDPGAFGCVRISWRNPYLGAPDSAHALTTCGGAFGRPDETLRDYMVGVAISASTTPPTSGWVETTFGAPAPGLDMIAALSRLERVHVWYRVRKVAFDAHPAELVADLRDPQPLELRPVIGAAMQGWYGNWASSLARDAAVDLRIDRDVPGRFDVVGVERQSGAPIRGEGLRVSPARFHPYAGDLWTHPARGRGPLLVGAPVLGRLDRAARLFRAARRAQAAGPGSSPDAASVCGCSSTWGRALSSGVSEALGLARWLGPEADTIEIAPDRRLRLYGLYTAERQLVRHQIRYVRTAADGTPLVDVMLAEYLPFR